MAEVRPIDANKLKKHPDMLLGVVSLIDAAPTLDYEPVVHGHWKVITFKNSRKKFIECSECGAIIDCLATSIDENEYDGCPYCRAKMDEEVKE